MSDFYEVCREGNIEIVKLMIEKDDVNGTYIDLDSGLAGACQGGHMEIVKLMIEKGADDWKEGFGSACQGGNMEIVKLMIEKNCNGANTAMNWNNGLWYACNRGHMKIARLMIEKGAYNYAILQDIKDLYLYKIFCTNFPKYINYRHLNRLIINSPIYTILSIINKVPKKNPVTKIPNDLWRMLHEFI